MLPAEMIGNGKAVSVVENARSTPRIIASDAREIFIEEGNKMRCL